jgi:hypothetical protein
MKVNTYHVLQSNDFNNSQFVYPEVNLKKILFATLDSKKEVKIAS